MPERTYTGGLPRGVVQIHDDDHQIVAAVPFTRDVPVEVTDDEAAALDKNPDWGGAPTEDDLEGLTKDALLEIADAEGVDVNKRFGVERLTETIRDHRIAQTEKVDDPEEPSNG